jgi:hypothetical protein
MMTLVVPRVENSHSNASNIAQLEAVLGPVMRESGRWWEIVGPKFEAAQKAPRKLYKQKDRFTPQYSREKADS